jgi:hypothetical protein
MTNHHHRALGTALRTVGLSPAKLARLSTGAVGNKNISGVECSLPSTLLYENDGFSLYIMILDQRVISTTNFLPLSTNSTKMILLQQLIIDKLLKIFSTSTEPEGSLTR